MHRFPGRFFLDDSFCPDRFFATGACLTVVMMAFNLMSRACRTLLKSVSPKTVKTLRDPLFGVAGYLTQAGREQILKPARVTNRRARVYRAAEAAGGFQAACRVFLHFWSRYTGLTENPG